MSKRYATIAVLVWLLAGIPAGAQEAMGIKLGPGWRLFPEFGALASYDTNFYYSESDEREIEGVLLRPALSVVREGNRSRAEAGVRGDIGEYVDLEEDDYVDGDVYGNFRFIATTQHRFEARALRSYGHDPFGLQRTEAAGTPGFSDRELDEFTQDELGGRYRFGATGARFNVGYEGILIDKTYDTNRELGTRFLDFDRVDHEISLTYNHSPKTDGLLLVRRVEYDYLNEVPNSVPRDFTQTQVLVGGTWQATGKTTGRILLGGVEHDPEDSRRSEFSEFDWDVQVDWRATAKSTLTFSTGRRTDDSFILDAEFINTQEYTLGWSHRWTPRVSTNLTAAHFDQEFEGVDREDEFRRIDLDGSILVTSDLALTAGLAYLDRESDISTIEFTKEVFTLGFRYRP